MSSVSVWDTICVVIVLHLKQEEPLTVNISQSLSRRPARVSGVVLHVALKTIKMRSGNPGLYAPHLNNVVSEKRACSLSNPELNEQFEWWCQNPTSSEVLAPGFLHVHRETARRQLGRLGRGYDRDIKFKGKVFPQMETFHFFVC